MSESETLPGSRNSTSAMTMVEFATSHLEVTTFGWDVAIGLYHCLLVYFLNKYGVRIWFRICNQSDHGIPWWKNLGTNHGQVSTGSEREDEILLRKLEVLAEKGWNPNQEPGTGESNSAPAPALALTPAPALATTAMAAEEAGGEADEPFPIGLPVSHSLSCSLVLTFQCVLSDEQIYKWAETLRKMFGSTPRVERFERSTIVQTSAWTHEGLLYDAAALVQKACADNPQCTLQVDSWGVFLCDLTGNSSEEKVKLIKIQSLQMPVITSASQSSAVDMLEIRGLHLDEADLIAQTHDQSIRLLCKSKSSKNPEGLDSLSVQCPPDALHQELHVYASKTIAVNGSLISVQCDRVKVVFTNEIFPTTYSTSWIVAALIVAVPMAQISLSVLHLPLGSSVSIVVGQGLGWLLGWFARKSLTARSARTRGIALKPTEKKHSSEKPEVGSSRNWGLDLLHIRRGSFVLLLVLLMLLSHWVWTQMGPVQQDWVLVGATTTTILMTIFKLRAKLRSRKEADTVSRSRYWMGVMSTAITYNEWTHAANMLHLGSGLKEAKLYDEAYVQGKLRELQRRRKEGTTDEVLFFLRADLTRHLGNLCNPDLHKHRREVPVVIRDYINEVRTHLQAVCDTDVDEFSLEEKLTFYTETRQRFGRTALMFSGHVALGTFHSSVFRTLVEHRLLPSVIVGANLGAIVASFATTRTASELRHCFDGPSLPMDFYATLSSAFVAAYRLQAQDARPYEIEKLQQIMQDLLGDLTFEEAFDLSGRVLGISLPACPTDHQPAQFLNYLASPHVVIWSAVAVSCVPPSRLHRPELMIKDRFGRIVPSAATNYMVFEEARSATSLETELPYRPVRELFNVNHFIVSQASPYMAPWLLFKESMKDRSRLASKLVNLVEMEVRHRCAQLLDVGIRLRGLTRLCAQEWEGDINIILPITFSQAIFVTSTLNDDHSPDELRKIAMAGRRSTWAKLSAIQASCGIELMLDEYISEFHRRERHALHREEAYNDLSLSGSIHQHSEFDIDKSRMNATTSQSPPTDEDHGACNSYQLSTEQSTPSEAETEDCSLDHLCDMHYISNPRSRRCDTTHTVSDAVHLVEPECDTIDDAHGTASSLFGDTVLSEWLHPHAQPAEELDHDAPSPGPSSPPHGLESVCEQYKLGHSKEVQLECDLRCEDSHSYGSPTTVLEGPTGLHLDSSLVVGRTSHPGCNPRGYFEGMSSSSFILDERDDDIWSTPGAGTW